MLPLAPDIFAIFDGMGWFAANAEFPVNPITFTPFTCPLLFSTGGWVCELRWVLPLPPCWCLSALVRRFWTGGSFGFRLTCSTGRTLLRFFGNFDRAYVNRSKWKPMEIKIKISELWRKRQYQQRGRQKTKVSSLMNTRDKKRTWKTISIKFEEKKHKYHQITCDKIRYH